jgi:multidrug resistance efflux pump
VKKLAVGILLSAALLIAVFAFAGCGGTRPAAHATPTASAPTVAVKLNNRIIAEGRVVPVRGVALSFQAGGNVAELPAALGDRVDAGKLLARLDTRQLELQLAQAEANLAAAQAKLNQLKRGPTAEDLAAAQQNLAAAQAAYDNLMHPGANELLALKADIDKTKALADQAQAAYDRIGGDSNPYASMTPQRAQLQIALLDYQKALALYNNKVNPPSAQVQQALAAVQNAKSQLARLQPTAEDLGATQANVNAAQAARDLIAEQVKNAKLIAPFAGIVTALDLKLGEYAAPGVPVARIADASSWQVETTDLTELNIVNVHVGDAATVSFDAIPELELSGKVTQIKGYGENRQGDIVYTITVALDKYDERLRWNMTAKVTIEPKQ